MADSAPGEAPNRRGSPRDWLIDEWARRAREHKRLASMYEGLRTRTAQTGGALSESEIRRAEEHGVRGLR